MEDNTRDWEDACRTNDEGVLECAVRGALFDKAHIALCSPELEDVDFYTLTATFKTTGIRCCAEPIGL